MATKIKNQELAKLDWQYPKAKIIPTLIKGKYAKGLFNQLKEYEKEFIGQGRFVNTLKYNSQSQTVEGSSFLKTGQINKFLSSSPEIRVAVPEDDFYGQVHKLIKGIKQGYTTFNSLVVQEVKKEDYFYFKKGSLWRNVVGLAEEHKGSIKFPFMMQGFYIVPDKTEQAYHTKIVPATNFKIIEDDRLSSKYNGWRFTKIDKTGLPVLLGVQYIDLSKNKPFSKGYREFEINYKGLASFSLNNSWFGNGEDIIINGGNLAHSSQEGRIVLVKNVPKNLEKLLEEKNYHT